MLHTTLLGPPKKSEPGMRSGYGWPVYLVLFQKNTILQHGALFRAILRPFPSQSFNGVSVVVAPHELVCLLAEL